MLFPKSRMRFTKTFQGKSEGNGYIVLDLAGMEMEGVTKIVVTKDDYDAIIQGGDLATQKLNQARSLLGGAED